MSLDLDWLKGKTIDHIDLSKREEFVLIHFTDGTMWLILSCVWNCGSSRLLQKFCNGRIV